MTTKSVSIATVAKDFPAGTSEGSYLFNFTGMLADGTTQFTNTVTSSTPSCTADFQPGTYVVSVTKNGVTSLVSDPFTIAVPAPATVSITVPDATAKPTVS